MRVPQQRGLSGSSISLPSVYGHEHNGAQWTPLSGIRLPVSRCNLHHQLHPDANEVRAGPQCMLGTQIAPRIGASRQGYRFIWVPYRTEVLRSFGD